MQLSIIIPVYNSEKYIDATLKSILPQMTEETELIVINDGSTDRSLDIIEENVCDTSNVIVISQENRGVSSARNAGLDVAKGKYVTFVDSDDAVEDDYIDVILKLIDSERDLYFFNIKEQIEGKTVSSHSWLKNDTFFGDRLYEIYRMIYEGRSFEPWDKVFLVRIIQEHNMKFPEGISLGEDIIFSLQFIVYISSAETTKTSIYCRNMHEGSLGTQIDSKTIAYRDAMFSQMLSTADQLDDIYIHYLAHKLILQVIANFTGKLWRLGYSNCDIYHLLSDHDWYREVITYRYRDYKSILRQALLKAKQYRLCARIFNK